MKRISFGTADNILVNVKIILKKFHNVYIFLKNNAPDILLLYRVHHLSQVITAC